MSDAPQGEGEGASPSDSPPDPSLRDRVFAGFAALGVARSWLVIGLCAALAAVGAWIGTGVETQTSRYEMVDADDPYQANVLAFFERFGYPDSPILMVRGGTPEGRRLAAGEMIAELETNERFAGRVLGRLGAQELSSVALLHRPGALSSLGASPDGGDPAAVIEQGMSGILGAIGHNLEAGLDQGEAAPGDDPAEGFGRLAEIANVFDRVLAGADLVETMEGLVEGQGRDAGLDEAGLDEEGYLVSNDGGHLLIAVLPQLDGTSVEDYRPAVEEIQAARDRVVDRLPAGKTDGVEIWLTGQPVTVVEETDLVNKAVWQSGLATGTLVFLVLLAAFRSLRQTIYALVPLGVGMAVSLAFVVLGIGHLNAITASLFAIVLGLGIDFAVHLMNRYHEGLRDGMAHPQAIRAAMVLAGPGVLTGAMTSVLAFSLVMVSEFTAFRELGIATGVGLLLVLGLTFLMLPALLSLGNGKASGKPEKAPPELPLVDKMGTLIRKAPMVLVILGVAASGFGAFSLLSGKVEFNPRYLDFLPERLESSKALLELERDGAMSPLFAFASAPTIEEAREITKGLREQPTVGSVQSPTDLLPPLDAVPDPEQDPRTRLEQLQSTFAAFPRDPDFQALRERDRSAAALAQQAQDVADLLDELALALDEGGQDAAPAEKAAKAFFSLRDRLQGLDDDGAKELSSLEVQLADLLEPGWTTARAVAQRGHYENVDLPPVFAMRFNARDGSGAVAMFVFPEEPIWDDPEAFSDDVMAVDPDAGGHAIAMHVQNQQIVDGFRRAAFYAIGLVVILLLIDFRRIDDTLLALLPVALGWGWLLAAMNIFDIPLDVANIVTLPLMTGIGIDAAVHMIHRYRQSERQHGTARLDELFTGTGSAVLLASVTTMTGFAGLTITDHGGTSSLGTLMVIGMGACLIGSLFLLPAVLLLLRRVR